AYKAEAAERFRVNLTALLLRALLGQLPVSIGQSRRAGHRDLAAREKPTQQHQRCRSPSSPHVGRPSFAGIMPPP
ncbi:hypothetical protein ABT261_50470, partial [Amycolatopsis sp. NPDC000740]